MYSMMDNTLAPSLRRFTPALGDEKMKWNISHTTTKIIIILHKSNTKGK